MRKKDTIKAISKKVEGFTLEDISIVLEALEEVVEENIKNEKVYITSGFSFSAVDVSEREYRNPSTGKPFVKPAHKKPKCHFSKNFKALVESVEA